MIVGVSEFYYIFWFIMSVLAASLAAVAIFYAFSLLQDIKQSLENIEHLLQGKAAKPKPKGQKRK
ncbi:MAG: hypothetical protein F4Z29_13525 [Gemmatimonadetes bacterium]|nr:hypothetical protein [Gemmatimonadota bacterium]